MIDPILFDQFLLVWRYIAIVITGVSGTFALGASITAVWCNPFDEFGEYRSRTAQVLTPILCFAMANLSILSLLKLCNGVVIP